MPVCLRSCRKQNLDSTRVNNRNLVNCPRCDITFNRLVSSSVKSNQLRFSVHQCDELLEREPWPSVESLTALDRDLIRDNISPGGSADLLAMCYMLVFLEEEAQ